MGKFNWRVPMEDLVDSMVAFKDYDAKVTDVYVEKSRNIVVFVIESDRFNYETEPGYELPQLNLWADGRFDDMTYIDKDIHPEKLKEYPGDADA